MYDKLEQGKMNKVIAYTSMNPNAARSHSLFSITVESSGIGADGKEYTREGKLNLFDLAGPERHSKLATSGDRFKEGCSINQSILALVNVISALGAAKTGYVPYRASMLTQLLRDSLGGNTKTLMIANIGPTDYNFEETLNTLRRAEKARKIMNKPKINESPKSRTLDLMSLSIGATNGKDSKSKGGPHASRTKIAREIRKK